MFKNGARSDPANYHPVSLICVICKLAEHVLCTHIRGHLDKYGILTSANYGFRSHHSYESQLLLTPHDLLEQHDQGHYADVGILDFSIFHLILCDTDALWTNSESTASKGKCNPGLKPSSQASATCTVWWSQLRILCCHIQSSSRYSFGSSTVSASH